NVRMRRDYARNWRRQGRKWRLLCGSCWQPASNAFASIRILVSRSAQSDDGSAASAGLKRRIAVIDHFRMPSKDGTNGLPLHADTASVDNAERFEAQARGFFQVFLDY